MEDGGDLVDYARVLSLIVSPCQTLSDLSFDALDSLLLLLLFTEAGIDDSPKSYWHDAPPDQVLCILSIA
jgi:hypothetical protein